MLQSVEAHGSVYGLESPVRVRLEQLLGERRYEDALAIVREMMEDSPEDAVLPRCVALLEGRLIKGWLALLGGGYAPLYRTADGHHPAWEQLTDEAARLAFVVDDEAGAEELVARSALPRFVGFRALAELFETGVISLTPRPAEEPPRRRRGWTLLVGVAVLAGAAVLAVSLWTRKEAPPVVAEAAPAAPAAAPTPVALPPAPAMEPLLAALRGPIDLALAAVEPAPPPPPEPEPAPAPPPPPSRAVKRPPPRIVLQDLTAIGVPAPAVRAGLERQSGRVRACYGEVPRERRPKALRAVVTFDRTGAVAQAAVWPLSPAGLHTCVRKALLRVRSHAPGRAGVTIALVR